MSRRGKSRRRPTAKATRTHIDRFEGLKRRPPESPRPVERSSVVQADAEASEKAEVVADPLKPSRNKPARNDAAAKNLLEAIFADENPFANQVPGRQKNTVADAPVITPEEEPLSTLAGGETSQPPSEWFRPPEI